MGRPYCKTGQFFECPVCGETFYRTPGQVKAGSTKTCSKKCLGISVKGAGNPFWGRSHSDATKKAVSESRKGKCIGNKNAHGYRHTDEAKKKIAAASLKMWSEDRDKIIASMPRGEKSRFHKPPELRRYRKEFTPRERREWTDNVCAYCGSTEFLELDHIIPVFDGGINERSNAQTLCRGCNLWKTKFVDLPRYHARLALQGGRNS